VLGNCIVPYFTHGFEVTLITVKRRLDFFAGNQSGLLAGKSDRRFFIAPADAGNYQSSSEAANVGVKKKLLMD
jgi:hypothetical protein